MAKNKKDKKAEAAAYAAGGAAAGATTSAAIGGMGLTMLGGVGIGIGMLPVTVAGAALGMAAYGVKKVMEDED